MEKKKIKETSPTTQAFWWDLWAGVFCCHLLASMHPSANTHPPLSPRLFSLHVLAFATPRALLICRRAVKGSACFGATHWSVALGRSCLRARHLLPSSFLLLISQSAKTPACVVFSLRGENHDAQIDSGPVRCCEAEWRLSILITVLYKWARAWCLDQPARTWVLKKDKLSSPWSQQTGTVLTSLWKLLLSHSGPFTCISGAYLKPILFCLKQNPLPIQPPFPFFLFLSKAWPFSPVISVWKLPRGRGLPFLWDKASLFTPFFHALYLVHGPEDSSFAELFSSSPRLCWVGDYLHSNLNLYYLKEVWLRASCRRALVPVTAEGSSIASDASIWDHRVLQTLE